MGLVQPSLRRLYRQPLNKLMAMLWLWLAVVASVQADESSGLASLTFITEEYPPYNYIDNQQLTGISIDLLEAIFAATETPLSRHDVRYYPWVRGYELALSQPNTVLFSTTRTPAREVNFHWVGPIDQDRVVLLAHRDAPIVVDSLAQAIDRGLTVVVIREDIGAQALLEAGYPERLLVSAIDNRSALNMLTRGRVELWAYSQDVAGWIATSEGYPKDILTPTHTLSESSLVFAINKATDPRLVALMQQALNKVQAGRVER